VSDTVSLEQLYRQAVTALTEAGIASPALDVGLLLQHVMGIPREAYYLRKREAVGTDRRQQFAAALARRLAHEPVARIIGRREFWSLSFRVTADTLDPRPDSETLIEAVLQELPDRAAPYRIADLGTGTGCLLLALLSELPQATGIGIDRCSGAAAVARDNANALGLDTRACFAVGDWAESLSGPVPIILCNPPYIARTCIPLLEPDVRHYDPWQALDGGCDGLEAYRILAPTVSRQLAAGGCAAIECGQGQARDIVDLFSAAGVPVARLVADLAGIVRCLVIRK